MLSGEGNAGERRKRTIGLISKKATLHVQQKKTQKNPTGSSFDSS